VGHVVAPELPSQEGRAQSHGIRDGTGAHLSKEVRFRAEGHVAAPELTIKLLEVHNQKEECCTWSLVATTSCILALKLTASLRLMIGSLFSFVSNPCLTFLSSACISFTPNQVYPLIHIYHRAILWWFHKHLLFTLIELVYR
jgi:hypothetical protein